MCRGTKCSGSSVVAAIIIISTIVVVTTIVAIPVVATTGTTIVTADSTAVVGTTAIINVGTRAIICSRVLTCRIMHMAIRPRITFVVRTQLDIAVHAMPVAIGMSMGLACVVLGTGVVIGTSIAGSLPRRTTMFRHVAAVPVTVPF